MREVPTWEPDIALSCPSLLFYEADQNLTCRTGPQQHEKPEMQSVRPYAILWKQPHIAVFS